MHMIAIGNAIQLQRVTSTFNHLSRSAPTATTLRRFQVHKALRELVQRQPHSTAGLAFQAYHALATMALANMTGKDDASGLTAEKSSLSSIVMFLKIAIHRKEYSGIRFRVYDVLFTLSVLCCNKSNHATFWQNGLVELVVEVIKMFRKDAHSTQFTSRRALAYPVLESATDCVDSLSKSELCRSKMVEMGLIPHLELLVSQEQDAVQMHAAKALWAIRDRQLVVSSAETCVKSVTEVKSISERYMWNEQELTLRLHGTLQQNNLVTRLNEAWKWLGPSLQNDRLSRLKHLMFGVQTKSLSLILSEFRRAVVRERQLRWCLSVKDRVYYASLRAQVFDAWHVYVKRKALMASAADRFLRK